MILLAVYELIRLIPAEIKIWEATAGTGHLVDPFHQTGRAVMTEFLVRRLTLIDAGYLEGMAFADLA